MNGLINFLSLVYNNWTSIIVCIFLIIGIVVKAANFIQKTDQEKLDIARTQIRETILRLVSKAEADYPDWNKAGKIKRAQVIKEIFETYPILSKVVNQEDVIEWIDIQIDNALVELNKVIESQSDNS